MNKNKLLFVLTVLGFGSIILWINDLAPSENQYGHEYSAAVILKCQERGSQIPV
jgi:hypothetical protein